MTMNIPLPPRTTSLQSSRSIPQRDISDPASARKVPLDPAVRQSAAPHAVVPHSSVPHSAAPHAVILNFTTPHPTTPHPAASRTGTPTPAPTTKVIVVSSVSGGSGGSVFAALLAWSLARRQHHCALVEADPLLGGIDALLGLENDPGLRWPDVRAPMGRLDAKAFVQELVHWEGVDILASVPWNDAVPQEWEVEAALSAVGEDEDFVIVDNSDHASVEAALSAANAFPQAARVVHVVMVPLSVLGVAKTKAWLARLRMAVAPQAWNKASWSAQFSGLCVLIAVPAARWSSKNRAVLELEEAANYLEMDIAGYLPPDAHLEKSVNAGLGIPVIPRRYARLMERVMTLVSGSADSGENSEEVDT